MLSEKKLREYLDNSSDLTLDDSVVKLTDSFEPIEEFEGVLDANGLTIKNLNNTFIETVKEDAVIKNLNFEDVSLQESNGIFGTNNGTLESVSVNNLERICDTSFGGLVFDNYGVIKDCMVKNATIKSTSAFVGGICCESEDGEIKNCEVVDTEIQSKERIGGIAGRINRTIIENCRVENVTLSARHTVAGVVCDALENNTIANTLVLESKLEAGFLLTGFVQGEDVFVKDSSIKDTVFNADRFIGLMCLNIEDGELYSCLVQDCTVNINTEKYNDAGDEIKVFDIDGTINNTFVSDTELRGSEVHVTHSEKSTVIDSEVELQLVGDETNIENDKEYLNIKT